MGREAGSWLSRCSVLQQGALRFTAGLPQPEALRRVGLLLEDVACQRQAQSAVAEALSLRLLSLQVSILKTLVLHGVWG